MKLIYFTILQVLILLFLLNVPLFANDNYQKQSKERREHNWVAPTQEVHRNNPIKKTHNSINRGAALFKSHCVDCHGVDAKGDGSAAQGMQPEPPDLTVMAGQHTDGDLAWKIATGKGPMPGWKNILNEFQIWDVVNFIKSLEKTTGAEHKHHLMSAKPNRVRGGI